MRDRAEAIARFLRLNYTPGTTDVPWEQADEDERAAWIEEALHICELADRHSPDAVMVRFTEAMIDAVKPISDAYHYTVSTWIRAVILREIEAWQRPDRFDDGSLSLDEVRRRSDAFRFDALRKP